MVKTYIRGLMRSIGAVKVFVAVLIVSFSVGTTQASAAEPFSDSLSGWIEVPMEDRLSIGDFYEGNGVFPVIKGFAPRFTTVYGSIKNKWNELGGEDGELGSTVVGEQETPDGTGRFAIFERGLIYWSPASGAVEITGGMLAQWVEDPEWWFGKLGFPVSSMREEDGRWVQVFQHGMMYAASARPPWASCGVTSDRKKVIKQWVGQYGHHRGRVISLTCGTKDGEGYRHIKERHLRDWKILADIEGISWMDLADQGITKSLTDAEYWRNSEVKNSTCYSGQIYLVHKQRGIPVRINYPTVVVGNDTDIIVTAYPGERCARH